MNEKREQEENLFESIQSFLEGMTTSEMDASIALTHMTIVPDSSKRTVTRDDATSLKHMANRLAVRQFYKRNSLMIRYDF